MAEQIGTYPAHVDFFRSLGDAMAAMMAIDMDEPLLSRITDAALNLHRAIRRLATQTIRSMVAHPFFAGESLFHYWMRDLMHFPRGPAG